MRRDKWNQELDREVVAGREAGRGESSPSSDEEEEEVDEEEDPDDEEDEEEEKDSSLLSAIVSIAFTFINCSMPLGVDEPSSLKSPLLDRPASTN